MKHVTPEEMGIPSKYIKQYVELLENKRLANHSVILAKGDNIVFEQYWKPFHKDFLHRMYSVSKSFVSIAIGFLLQDGLINLDDTMAKHFSKELEKQTDENMRGQTIKDMLMMCTAKPNRYWFDYKPDDRVAFYFENDMEISRPSGTIFQYDSEGSFVLGALVERLTGKSLMEYLREKLFDAIGVSKEAYCLKCPGGHSWGDSGVLCKSIDLLRVAKFVMNKGSWNGKQLLNENYLMQAVNCKVFNNYWDINDCNTQGYGLKFWGTYDDSFFFNGMGNQFAVCVPKKDLILIYNGDNQGRDSARGYIIDKFFELIVKNCTDEKLKADESEYLSLQAMNKNAELIAACGEKYSDFEKEINGKYYTLDKNPMNIKKFRITFDNEGGNFEYTNAQGDKVIPFGRCKNVFCDFPQEGYSDDIGTVATKGIFYNCACSAAWVETKKLYIKVQIIDKYFGNLGITIGFKEDKCGLYMNKCAEDFLKEYQGIAGGKS